MRVCIVGNGESNLNNRNGAFIDSCDIVIRMKEFKIDGYEDCVGTKTDIYSSKWFSWFQRVYPYHPLDMHHINNVQCCWFFFTDPNTPTAHDNPYVRKYIERQLPNEFPMKDGNIDMHNKWVEWFGISNIKYASVDEVFDLAVRQLKLDHHEYDLHDSVIEPSVGIRTIHRAVDVFNGSDIYITGFDCFSTSWYWDSRHVANSKHNYMRERIYLERLTRTAVTAIDR